MMECASAWALGFIKLKTMLSIINVKIITAIIQENSDDKCENFNIS
jgi:hypothetical protein